MPWPGEAELNRYWADLASRGEGDPKLAEELRRDLCRGSLIGGRSFLASLLGGTVEVSLIGGRSFLASLLGGTVEVSVIGGRSFLESLLGGTVEVSELGRFLARTSERDAVETEEQWSTLLDRLLSACSRTRKEIASARKSATNGSVEPEPPCWLAQTLGTPEAFNTNFSKWRKCIKYVA